MPFIKRAESQAGRPPGEMESTFTGRVNEQRFFVKHVLTPEVPTAHQRPPFLETPGLRTGD